MQILAKDFSIVPLAAIKPYDGNSRKHSARQVDKIAASIAEFGFNAPILIDADMTIVAGHGRYAAAQKLGLVDVPVIQLGHLSDAKRRAYVIADNRIAEDASWDMTKLASEVQALQLDGLELDAIGLDDVDMTRIDIELRRMAADLEMIDAPPVYHQPQPAPAAAPAVAPAAQAAPVAPQPAPQQPQEASYQPAPATFPAQPAPTYQAAPSTPPPPAMVPFQVLMQADRRDCVLRVLNATKTEHGLATLGDALHWICAALDDTE